MTNRFDYRLRISARSRNVCLRVTPEQGLEIVVPRGYDLGLLSDLLKRKERWIRRALERVEAYRQALGFGATWELPQQVQLLAIDRVWGVSGLATSAGRVTVRETEPGSLRITGAIADERASRAALRRWLIGQAQTQLRPWLERLSRATGLRHTGVSVRCQKTRWGSCSRHGVISLNAKLLFLPPPIVEYVLIHELCHLVHMNHSKRFWARVAKHCPEFRERDRQLRERGKRVPRWAI